MCTILTPLKIIQIKSHKFHYIPKIVWGTAHGTKPKISFSYIYCQDFRRPWWVLMLWSVDELSFSWSSFLHWLGTEDHHSSLAEFLLALWILPPSTSCSKSISHSYPCQWLKPSLTKFPHQLWGFGPDSPRDLNNHSWSRPKRLEIKVYIFIKFSIWIKG